MQMTSLNLMKTRRPSQAAVLLIGCLVATWGWAIAEAQSGASEPAETPPVDMNERMKQMPADYREASDTSSPQQGAATQALCEEAGEPEAPCQCAVDKLRDNVGEDDFRVFDDVVAEYRANQAKGDPDGPAWQKAMNAEAERQARDKDDMAAFIYRIGESFRKLTALCGGKT